LVVEYEFANRVRKLVALPLALESPCGVRFVGRRSGTSGPDGIRGRTEFVCGDMCGDGGLASGVCSMPCRPTEVSGGAHGMAACRAGLHHLDLAAYPPADVVDRLMRPFVLRARRLEKVNDVLRTRRCPQCEQMMVRICESSTAAQCDEARITDLRKDHRAPFCTDGVPPAAGAALVEGGNPLASMAKWTQPISSGVPRSAS
jgi:hypothetical protein